jgi:Vacuolar protein sorting-associated protein 62
MAEDRVLTRPVTSSSADQQGLSRQELLDAIATYAPILKLHPDEAYKMCSVEAFLQHARLHDKATGTEINHPSVDQLPTGTVNDGRYWLILEDGFKPGDMAGAKAYVRALWQPGMSYTDLQFWFLYAYNGPGTAHLNGLVFDQVVNHGDAGLAPLGEHYGDWECCMIRVDNSSKTMFGAWLSQHAAGRLYLATQLSEFGRTGGHIHVHASHNGHANYASDGANHSEHLKLPDVSPAWLVPAAIEFDLRNETADGGPTLACAERYEIVSADWLGGAFPEPRWLDYPYRWGPEGTTTHMSPTTVYNILSAALGWIAALFAAPAMLLAGYILAYFVTDDLNGPTGPKMKSAWKGAYPSYGAS